MNLEYVAYVIGVISGIAGILVLIFSHNPIHRRIGVTALVFAVLFLAAGRFILKDLTIIEPEGNLFQVYKLNNQCFTEIRVKKFFLTDLDKDDYITVLFRLKHQNSYWMPASQIDKSGLVDNIAYFPDVPVGFPDGETHYYELYAGITKDKYSQGKQFKELPKHFYVFDVKNVSRTCGVQN